MATLSRFFPLKSLHGGRAAIAETNKIVEVEIRDQIRYVDGPNQNSARLAIHYFLGDGRQSIPHEVKVIPSRPGFLYPLP